MITLGGSREDAYAILTHPEIYPNITDDFSTEFSIPGNMFALVAYSDDVPAACVTLLSRNGIKLEIHVQILPDYRHMSDLLGKSMLNWIWDNTTAQKLVAEIAFKFENVKRYAESMGFQVEGISKGSIMLDGRLTDQWIMGLSKWQQR